MIIVGDINYFVTYSQSNCATNQFYEKIFICIRYI